MFKIYTAPSLSGKISTIAFRDHLFCYTYSNKEAIDFAKNFNPSNLRQVTMLDLYADKEQISVIMNSVLDKFYENK